MVIKDIDFKIETIKSSLKMGLKILSRTGIREPFLRKVAIPL